MKSLTVTSPMMTGADVRAAQKALQKNPFGSYYKGEIDGEYGPLTSSASKDAKFWLGYQGMNVRPGYGEALHELLTGKADLSDPMQARRKARKARPDAEQLRRDALELAITQLGIKESPAGSNRVKYTAWYGMGAVAWCAIFQTWCGVRVGLSAFIRGRNWAYCPFMVADALEGRNGLRARGRSEQPDPGDLVLYHFGNSDGVARHVGIFEKGTRSSFTAIEGNTSVTSDDNGGEVMRRQRTGDLVRLFCYAVR
jgi:peptidoglycan hydrolase-like protein with peptidoglycan-binding domain